MKALNFIFIISILILLSCNKDDDQPDVEPQEITIPLTVDLMAFSLYP